MVFIKKRGFTVAHQADPSELHFDEKTGTVRILVKRDDPEMRVVSATPVIMPRKVRRDIKKSDTEKYDEKTFSKITICRV